MPGQNESPGLEVHIDGRKTVIRLDSMTGRDVKDFRGEVGFAPARAFREENLMDIDVIAAFVWIERRRNKASLTYDDVLDGISYTNMKVVSDNVVDEEGEEDPEG